MAPVTKIADQLILSDLFEANFQFFRDGLIVIIYRILKLNGALQYNKNKLRFQLSSFWQPPPLRQKACFSLHSPFVIHQTTLELT